MHLYVMHLGDVSMNKREVQKTLENINVIKFTHDNHIYVISGGFEAPYRVDIGPRTYEVWMKKRNHYDWIFFSGKDNKCICWSCILERMQ